MEKNGRIFSQLIVRWRQRNRKWRYGRYTAVVGTFSEDIQWIHPLPVGGSLQSKGILVQLEYFSTARPKLWLILAGRLTSPPLVTSIVPTLHVSPAVNAKSKNPTI